MVSSIGASAMPWRAKNLTSALTLCPIFSTAGSSSTGSQQRERLGERHLALGRRVEEVARRRRRGRAAGRRPRPGRSRARGRRARRASRRRRSSRRRCATTPRSRMRATQSASAARVAQEDVRGRVDRRQRHRLALGRRRRPLLRPRRSGSIAGAATPSAAATRPARPRNSISPSQASSVVRRRARAPRARRAAPRAARRAAASPGRARCGSARRGRAAPRAASAA